MDNKKILIVEDQQDIANLLALHLSDLGAAVSIANDGHRGMALATSKNWDLLILDIQLPGPSGLDICRAVRKAEQYTPILLLTSRSSELDRVLGLDIGADDYLTKPFSVLELIARVRAIFRRADAMTQRAEKSQNRVALGSLTIDGHTRSVTLGGQAVELTAKEFDLLQFFAAQPGRVFRRSELLDSVWGYGHDGYEHTVNSHINRLRAKIEADPNNPAIISTVWGVGYKLDPDSIPP